MNEFKLEDIISLSKRRGFIYPGSEIYGGLSGTWDYGPLGVSLKRSIENLWWNTFVESRTDMYGLDSAILMNSKVWQASGHLDTFIDPLIEDAKTKKRYRLDHLLEDNGYDVSGLSLDQMVKIVEDNKIVSAEGHELKNPTKFNLMFKSFIGPVEDSSSIVYLRPETAQGMFTNFRNIIDSFYPDLPFGIAQIGKCFRNEISPRDFLFRSRELEIMEFEYFVDPSTWQAQFDRLIEFQLDWYHNKLKLDKAKIRQVEIPKENRAHYSSRTIDFEYQFPFGFKEIGGFSYRGDFDLTSHQKLTQKSFEYINKKNNERIIPHVLEPSFGLDRQVLAVICDSYRIDQINGEQRVYLDLPREFSAYLVAVSPLLKNKPELVQEARKIFDLLKSKFAKVTWDDNGNIGKRYRRQDEIGTPFCVTVDFETVKDKSVTVRDRNSTKQQRIKVADLIQFFNNN